jgi:hypothetical protein
MLKFILLLFLGALTLNAQEIQKDSLPKNYIFSNTKFNPKQLIIPALLIGYGVIGIETDQLKRFDHDLQEEVKEHIDKKITIDDFSQYAPAVSVYALNIVGIKGKNNLRNRSILFATSYLVMTTSVLALKSLTKVERPDGTSANSFPSGHTATAFAGAEFLWQEYKEKSIGYGIVGYVVATGTGIFRIVNNRHWLTDVAAGAGIGILSTKIAYWINPFIQEKIFKSKEKNDTTIIVPFYNGNQYGVSLLKSF